MIGLGESYFSAYALFLGANNFQMGVLTSLPPLIAGLSQFKTLRLMKLVPSRRKLVCLGVFFQALSFFPIVLVYYFNQIRIEIYIALVIFYFTSNAIIGPVWNSWMGDLVRVSQRGIYFGRRNRIITLGTFLSMVLAGLILKYSVSRNLEYQGFIVIFGLAFVARIWSLYNLFIKYDPPYKIPEPSPNGFLIFIRGLYKKNSNLLILYMSFVNFAVFISAAYFTPIMLKEYHFNYLVYTLIVGGAALTKFLTSSFWGEICDKLGARQVLTTCGFLITFTTVPWLFSQNPWVLFLAQCYTGFVWAGYELSTFTFLLDTTEAEERAELSSYLNILTSTGGFLGGMCGALMFVHRSNTGPREYFLVLFASIVMRFVAFALVGWRLKEVRVLGQIKTSEVYFKASGFKSAMGLTSKLVVFAKRRKQV